MASLWRRSAAAALPLTNNLQLTAQQEPLSRILEWKNPRGKQNDAGIGSLKCEPGVARRAARYRSRNQPPTDAGFGQLRQTAFLTQPAHNRNAFRVANQRSSERVSRADLLTARLSQRKDREGTCFNRPVSYGFCKSVVLWMSCSRPTIHLIALWIADA